MLSGADREQTYRAFEVAPLLALRRALRNGIVWIDHSLAFRSRERLFIPTETWQKERNSYYRRLSLTKRAESYLEPLIERAQAGVAAVAKAVEAGELRIDDELHLTPLAAEEEEQELVKLRAALDHRIGEAQLPALLLEVDANVRFRVPGSGLSERGLRGPGRVLIRERPESLDERWRARVRA